MTHCPDYSYLANVLLRRAGIVLAEKKTHMIETRLMPVVRRFGFRDIPSLLKELHYGHEALVQAVIEAMTTNDSAFFRDRKTFDEFRDIVLPALKEARSDTKQLKIWCTACAAGQEPYSIAMLLDDAKLADEGWSITLVATDINSQMIARAQEGVYSQFEVQRGLPIRRLVSNFTQEGANWRISDHLRRMVTFRTFNLLDSYGWLPDCDVVFCRNVLMYFDLKTRASVLERIGDILMPDGALLVGPAESMDSYILGYVLADSAPGLFYKSRPAPARRLSLVK
ncbi:CheR family methyltransferase [Rhizomicrobium electricum]|uniref:protein-glutamate O-methyltransferase n=1 Tax=Rhizomicrobium electricum TaxID=480070 RepID=A0ABN1EK58_9PROT|nr:chemotaxis protein methyltransferase CheR [Rhizomicrobium electricum]